jgi:hypothetical protein
VGGWRHYILVADLRFGTIVQAGRSLRACDRSWMKAPMSRNGLGIALAVMLPGDD